MGTTMLVRHKVGLLLSLAATLAGCAESQKLEETAAASGGAAGLASGGAPAGGAGGGPSGGSGGGISIDAGIGGKKPVGVPKTCAEADLAQSYLGCEYWPTVTLNSEVSEVFEFAIAAANPTDTTAELVVERDGKPVQKTSVEPGKLATLTLPWIPELKQTRWPGNKKPKSGRVKAGAYHVTSSVPIVLYQFNPLEFAKGPPPPTTGNCIIDLDTNSCFSFSNDASLLLPQSALGTEYLAMSRPSFQIKNDFGTYVDYLDYPSFVTITATRDGTTVTVKGSAKIRAGDGVAPAEAGATTSYSLDQGDVLTLTAAELAELQLGPAGKPCAQNKVYISTYHLCTSGDDYDFTGTRISSNQPVSVISGHDCTMVPYDRWACDHLEESMFPVSSLGTELVVTQPRSTASLSDPTATDPTFVRILSAAADNEIEFEPAAIHPKTKLGDGQWIEIGPVSEDFVVRAKNRISVAQFLTGKNATGYPVKGEVGDPAQSLAIPVEQYRREYTVLAPVSYPHNYANLIAKVGTTVSVDGTPVPASEFSTIGSSGWAIARREVTGGPHSITGTSNVGVVMYGYGNFTSYAYPGGLNLEPLIITPK